MLTIGDVVSPFGLHFYSQNEEENSKYYKKYMNISNICSAVPYVRIIVGIWRIYKHIPFINTTEQGIGLVQIARGIIELTPYGMWLIIPDVLVTTLRAIALIRANRFSMEPL